jgi:hypothetical protein
MKELHDECRVVVASPNLLDDSLAYCSCHCGDSSFGALPSEWPKAPKSARKQFKKKFPEFPNTAGI